MTKTLQKKFVMTAMIAITVLILILLGAINIFNIVSVDRKIDENLRMIAENEGDMRNLMIEPEIGSEEIFDMPEDTTHDPASDTVPGTVRRGPFLNEPKNDYDTFISSNFFVVRFDRGGQATYIDVTRTSSVSESEAGELAKEVYTSDKTSGRTGRFHYLMVNSRDGNDRILVFLDTSEERFSCFRVLLLSGAIGIICWGLMLALVILLSRRAIRPIAENIEKQRQFVTNAGHEIKTPLAIIQSNTEAMELYIGENKWSRNIKEQTIRLDGLMKNLLTLSRMEESEEGSQKTEVNLSGMLTERTQEFLPLMEEKKISLQTEISPEITLQADPGQMEQLISILLDNAVKYSNEDGLIEVCLHKQDGRIRLQMENTCQCLPQVPPEKLFDRFYRADEARTQKNGGYGIGLSVARSIAEAHKGTIDAKYIQPDRICFTVRI